MLQPPPGCGRTSGSIAGSNDDRRLEVSTQHFDRCYDNSGGWSECDDREAAMHNRNTDGVAGGMFDRREGGVTIAVGPRPPGKPGEWWLWWTIPASPAMIEELLELIDSRGISVEAIVIVGLDRYPVSFDEWAKLLVRWNDSGCVPVTVETAGLSATERRRLVAKTRRRAIERSRRDPWKLLRWALRRWTDEMRQCFSGGRDESGDHRK